MTVTREVQDMWDKRDGLLCIFPLKGDGSGCPLLRDLLTRPPSTRRDASFALASTF